MPERALLRLRRAGIAVYNAKKTQKNRILLSVNKKDIQKVFAIYPKVCYNISEYSPYTVRKIGAEGIGKYAEWMRNRVGILLGGLLFIASTFVCSQYVFAVDFAGASVYAREAYQALEEAGIRPYARYDTQNLTEAKAKLFALSGVEYCSVKKVGMRAVVEIRISPFTEIRLQTGEMKAKHAGTLLALTVIRGEALKKAGDSVTVGERLVADRFTTTDGEQVCVDVIAYARIACVHEGVYEAETKQEAFAKAYLALGLSAEDVITQSQVTEANGGYLVQLSYTVYQRMNF